MNLKSLFYIGLIMLLFSNFTTAQCTLDIEISGIKNNEGNVLLQVFDEKQKVLTQVMSGLAEKRGTESAWPALCIRWISETIK